MSDSEVVRARAFAPGHVTGVFRPTLSGRDPRARGSTGAGVVLELGVRATAEFRPNAPRRLRLTSDLRVELPISEEVARRLFPPGRGALSVQLVHQLPVGQGFGMSAAGALATARAVGAISGVPPTEAVEVAHLADLFGGGGLGGVAAIAGGGGLEFRTRAGLPPEGHVRHHRFSESLLVGVLGRPIPSPRLLRSPGFLARVGAAGEGLDELLRHPEAERFFDLSEQFTDRMGLAAPPLTRLLRGLRRRGGWAAQAMFGQSFFARPRSPTARSAIVRWLLKNEVPVVELAAARRGGRALP